MKNTKKMLIDFVNQRPGFDLANYCSMNSYRQDYNETLKDKHSFFELLSLAESRIENFEELLYNELKNNSGRLSINENNQLTYCTGQYFPVEYRAAACRLLASIIWADYRDEKNNKGQNLYNTGNEIRKAVKRNYHLRTRNTKVYFS
jgi:hypothetical protein